MAKLINITSTTGGHGGPTTTVTTLSALTSAVAGDSPKIVIISGKYYTFCYEDEFTHDVRQEP